MNKNEEIYYIIFNKCVREGRMIADSYTLGMATSFGVPESIIIKADKITVVFEDRSKHTFTYDENVEIFTRIKETKKDNFETT